MLMRDHSSDDVQRRGSDDLESTAEEARELAAEAEGVAEARRRAAARGPAAPDGRADDPPEELRARILAAVRQLRDDS
jgi:hypothetical protein